MINFADGWSVSETSSLAIKAARGVGMPWGIAEEAGFALRWLTRNGAPGVVAICRYLSAYQRAKYCHSTLAVGGRCSSYLHKPGKGAAPHRPTEDPHSVHTY